MRLDWISAFDFGILASVVFLTTWNKGKWLILHGCRQFSDCFVKLGPPVEKKRILKSLSSIQLGKATVFWCCLKILISGSLAITSFGNKIPIQNSAILFLKFASSSKHKSPINTPHFHSAASVVKTQNSRLFIILYILGLCNLQHGTYYNVKKLKVFNVFFFISNEIRQTK